jgi:hypothetical protein
MRAEDLAHLDSHDLEFYNAPNNNSLDSLVPARGYVLEDIATGEPLKYGMTTRGTARYTQAQMQKWNAKMVFQADGSVAEMRQWETKQILDYFESLGEYPPLNYNNH